MRVYEAKTYREFLRAAVAGDGASPARGNVKRLSEHLRCHSTYVSQVLKGKADLSLDQGASFCAYLKMPPDETEFFLDLLSRDRAGGKEARAHYQGRLDRRLAELSDMKKRWKIDETLTAEQEQAYYESWIPQAVHLHCQLPGQHTPTEVAAALGLEAEKATATLAVLERLGFVARRGGAYVSIRDSVHLGRDSRIFARYHLNWRIKAALDLTTSEGAPGRHYSSVMSLSPATARAIEDLLLANIEQTRELVVPSPPETLYVYNVDFYPLLRQERAKLSKRLAKREE